MVRFSRRPGYALGTTQIAGPQGEEVSGVERLGGHSNGRPAGRGGVGVHRGTPRGHLNCRPDRFYHCNLARNARQIELTPAVGSQLHPQGRALQHGGANLRKAKRASIAACPKVLGPPTEPSPSPEMPFPRAADEATEVALESPAERVPCFGAWLRPRRQDEALLIKCSLRPRRPRRDARGQPACLGVRQTRRSLNESWCPLSAQPQKRVAAAGRII